MKIPVQQLSQKYFGQFSEMRGNWITSFQKSLFSNLLPDFLVSCKSPIHVFTHWVDLCGLSGYLTIDSDDCTHFFTRERKSKLLLILHRTSRDCLAFFVWLDKVGSWVGTKFSWLSSSGRSNTFFSNKVRILLPTISVILGTSRFVRRSSMCTLFQSPHCNRQAVNVATLKI